MSHLPPSPPRAPVELGPDDLPALCPHPAMPVWNQHPRVALDLSYTGEAVCPYCSTVYRLKPGTVVAGH